MVGLVLCGTNREVLNQLRAIRESCSESGERITVEEYVRQNGDLPSYALAVNEWVGDGKGRISPRLKHITYRGEGKEDLEMWLIRHNYQLVGIDGPY